MRHILTWLSIALALSICCAALLSRAAWAQTPAPTLPPDPGIAAEIARADAEVVELYPKRDYEGALRKAKEGLLLCRRAGDRSCEGTVLGIIAFIYDDMQRYTLALEFY